jgi:predicted nucleic acid-binding protein
MSATALDTSVVIAALLSWHESHTESLRALEAAAKAGRLIVPAPALVEAFSVMTRLPAPHRIAPRDAHHILSGSFERRVDVVGLTGSETWRLIRESATEGVAGGTAYDALILACSRKARATRLLTLDRDDFLRLAPDDIEIVVP